ncbi:MAG: hypothetical protein WKF96_16580 [Solirubrobacteraceae bacterium]
MLGRDAMSIQYVRDTYGVPVRRGQRVIHGGRDHGTVTCCKGAHVRVRFDGERHSESCHPLSLDYGDGVQPDDRLAHRNARIDAWNDRLNGRITADEYRDRMGTTPVSEARLLSDLRCRP